jgi:hypothetical protein
MIGMKIALVIEHRDPKRGALEATRLGIPSLETCHSGAAAATRPVRLQAVPTVGPTPGWLPLSQEEEVSSRDRSSRRPIEAA